MIPGHLIIITELHRNQRMIYFKLFHEDNNYQIASRFCCEYFTAPSPWILTLKKWFIQFPNYTKTLSYHETVFVTPSQETRGAPQKERSWSWYCCKERFTNTGRVKSKLFLFHYALPSSGVRPPSSPSRQSLTMEIS